MSRRRPERVDEPVHGTGPASEGVTRRLVEQALTLIARAEGSDVGTVATAQSTLTAWRQASAAHEAAYREADARWRAVGGAVAELRGDIPEPPMPPRPSRGRKWRIAGAGAAIALVITFGLALLGYLRQPEFVGGYRTATAELARVELPDGSQIELAPRSALQVRYLRDRRAVEFEAGEVRFEVVRDPARPFVVSMGGVMVRAMGTAFTVTDRGGPLIVAVENGRVAVSLETTADTLATTTLAGGERIRIEKGRAGPVERVSADHIAPWRRGWLVFDNVPLAEAICSINAYLPVPITIGDSKAAGQRLTGSFRTSAPDAILDALPRILSVEVRRTAAGHREIVSRR